MSHMLIAKAEIMLRGRLFNWFPSDARRKRRGKAIESVADRYLRRFLPREALPGIHVVEPAKPETIFSLWLQGEDAAPPLIKACARSVQANCPGQKHIVLDERSIFDYVELPGVIIDKRRHGKIGHAHFSDILRLELLHNHGGYWLDSTCFMTGAVPALIEEQDFFVYMAGDIYPYSFIQNCFIRAKKGAYLLEAWRAMVLDYWKKESIPLNYFVHQMLLRALIQNDAQAMDHFAGMPQIPQEPTHSLWWRYGKEPFDEEIFRSVTADAFWQKTSYRSQWAINPPAGSFADEMINKMYR